MYTTARGYRAFAMLTPFCVLVFTLSSQRTSGVHQSSIPFFHPTKPISIHILLPHLLLHGSIARANRLFISVSPCNVNPGPRSSPRHFFPIQSTIGDKGEEKKGLLSLPTSLRSSFIYLARTHSPSLVQHPTTYL
jgi:hypothetical protein